MSVVSNLQNTIAKSPHVEDAYNKKKMEDTFYPSANADKTISKLKTRIKNRRGATLPYS